MWVQAQIVDLLRDAAGEAQPRLSVHQPRPEGGARAGQRGDRDAQRRRSSSRGRRREIFERAADRLHEGADGGGPSICKAAPRRRGEPMTWHACSCAADVADRSVDRPAHEEGRRLTSTCASGRTGWADVDDIEYCAAWLPPPGVLTSLPNLKAIFSLGAGVDAILSDPTLPGRADRARRRSGPDHAHERIRRAACADAPPPAAPHRREAEGSKVWEPSHPCRHATSASASWAWACWARTGRRSCATWASGCAGWSRSRKAHSRASRASLARREFDAFLATHRHARVAAAAHARDRRHHQPRDASASSRARSASARPVLINAGRGASRWRTTFSPRWTRANCMPRRSTCSRPSRCRRDSPLWTHPRVTVTPHGAADSDPETICAYVAAPDAPAPAPASRSSNLVDREARLLSRLRPAANA